MDYFLFNFSGVQFHYTMSHLIIQCLLGIHASGLEKKLQKIKTDQLKPDFASDFSQTVA